MNETGVVVEAGSVATVRVVRNSACSKCRRCSPAADHDGFILVEAINEVGAQVGDTVSVAIPTSDALLAAAYAYLIPLVFGVLGMALGTWLGPKVGWSGESAGALCGLGLLAISYAILARIDRAAKAQGRFRPVIERVYSGIDRPAKN